MFKIRRNSRNNQELADIMSELSTLKKKIRSAEEWFDYERDNYLIDSCSYELKALQLRYEYLVRRAKEYTVNNSDKIEEAI